MFLKKETQNNPNSNTIVKTTVGINHIYFTSIIVLSS